MSFASLWSDRLLPLGRWRGLFGSATLRADLLAGLLGAVVVLPMAVAFATLAGLPPQFGLYAAMVPAVVAALWGSSHHMVSGPTNPISLVVFATLAPLAEPGSADYLRLALTLALMVGALQLAMGFARLGSLVNFISHTVVIGFTAGAGLLIMASQIKPLFGLAIAQGTSFFGTLTYWANNIETTRPGALTVGMATIISGALVKRFLPRLPYMLAAMLAGSFTALALDALLGTERTGIRYLGALPGALPPLSIPDFSLGTLRELMDVAVAVTALALAEAASIARAIAVKSGQRIDANQEFIGQGLANLSAAFFSGYATSGSFSRSGLNYESGAKTPLAAAASAGFLILILIFLAPLAIYIPIASMAGLLMLVAWGLIDLKEIGVVLRSSRSETAVLAVTFGATLILHLEFAILAGIALSLVLYLNRTSQPSIRSLIPDAAQARKFRELGPGEADCPQLGIVRVEGSLYFGAVDHVAAFLQAHAALRPGQQHLLLMSKSINFIDVAGARMLQEEARRRRAAGGRLHFYSLRRGAEAILHQPDFAQGFDDGVYFQSKHAAISEIFRQLDHERCRNCTARIFLECASVPPPARDDPATAGRTGTGPRISPPPPTTSKAP